MIIWYGSTIFYWNDHPLIHDIMFTMLFCENEKVIDSDWNTRSSCNGPRAEIPSFLAIFPMTGPPKKNRRFWFDPNTPTIAVWPYLAIVEMLRISCDYDWTCGCKFQHRTSMLLFQWLFVIQAPLNLAVPTSVKEKWYGDQSQSIGCTLSPLYHRYNYNYCIYIYMYHVSCVYIYIRNYICIIFIIHICICYMCNL
jgi:hypothetical protein